MFINIIAGYKFHLFMLSVSYWSEAGVMHEAGYVYAIRST